MADTGAVSVEEFVREAVRRYRPEELARLDDALTIYFANPATVLAARRREGETGAGAGVGAAAAVVVPALLVILHDLAIALTADAAKGDCGRCGAGCGRGSASRSWPCGGTDP
ncbi:hypothetical protein ACFQ0M_05045 [Kitasatospora aburaviensis]